jgi:hypothetical protein
MENQMTELSIPVPPVPILERAVGYRNEHAAHYLALWWEPCGDEVMVSDGYITFTGHWPGYLAYIQHPVVAPALANYNLGSSEEPATHRLLIDLESRQAYIVIGVEGERILASQWERQSRSQPATLFIEDLEALLRGWAETEQEEIPMEEIMRRIEEDQKAVETLRAWMDAQIP